MKPSRGSGSEVEEISEEVVMEGELLRLNRGYRVMNNSYRAYREETKRHIAKQNNLIEVLQCEQEDLDKTLAKMVTRPNVGKDEDNSESLRQFALGEKEYTGLIQKERRTISQLEDKILHMENKICKQSIKMGGVHNSSAIHMAVAKKRMVLENRLAKATTQFGDQLTSNQEIRDRIDHLRLERQVFNKLEQRLTRQLQQGQEEIGSLIETSAQAFDQRFEAQNKMAALRERSDKDQQQHRSEMKTLLRTINHDNKIKEFMSIKNSERAEYKADEAARKNKDAEAVRTLDRNTIEFYEQAFQEIKKVTSENDISAIAVNFVKKEEQNFALFNYVNELNAEKENLHEQVTKLTQQIAHFAGDNTTEEAQHTEVIKDMEDTYSAVHGEAHRTGSQLHSIKKDLDQLKASIMGMFKLIGCSEQPIRKMLGGEMGITKKNAMVYLGQIEHKTMELLHALNFQSLKNKELQGVPPGKTEVVIPEPPQHTRVYITPIHTGDDSESDLEEDEPEIRPLTHEEVRARVIRQLDKLSQRGVVLKGQSDTSTRGKANGKRKKTNK